MAGYLVRYTVEVEALNGKPVTFYHNANSLQQNLYEQAGGVVSPALVIHDQENAIRLARIYAEFSETVEVLEAHRAVGTMTYHGPRAEGVR